MDIAKRFGVNLRRARKEAGMSQETAAIRASVHRTEVGLLERGERMPRMDTAIKMAGAVGVPRPIWSRGSPGRQEKRSAAGSSLPPSYPVGMAKRSRKPADLNRLAAAIVDEATDQTPPQHETPEARAGRTGGRKGGKARAASMSAEERSAAAKRAAEARWSRAR